MKMITVFLGLMVLVVFVAWPLAMAGCPSPASTILDAGGSVATITEAAVDRADALCRHLEAIDCSQGPTCAEKVRQIEAARLTDLHESQLFAAVTREQAIAVGTVSCTTGDR